ncbi:NUDIX hydrolase [Streptomyces decoyicus]
MTDTTPDLTELRPLAALIARTIQATPVHLGSSEGAADLSAAITVAVAAYMGRELGPAPGVLGEIVAERARQDARWGEQNHPDGTGSGRQQDMGQLARADCGAAFRSGNGTWGHVLFAGTREAIGEADPARLRAGLVKVAADAVAWIEAIDRRTAAEPTPAS